jgi:hypothetical protein
MTATPGVPARPADPVFARFDALAERYEALGGTRTDLLR